MVVIWRLSHSKVEPSRIASSGPEFWHLQCIPQMLDLVELVFVKTEIWSSVFSRLLFFALLLLLSSLAMLRGFNWNIIEWTVDLQLVSWH